MKFIAFVAVASAFVLPDDRVASQLVLADDNAAAKVAAPFGVLRETTNVVKTGVNKATDAVRSWFLSADVIPRPNALAEDGDLDALTSLKGLSALGQVLAGDKNGVSNLTLYQLITSSNNTTQFAALLNEFPTVVALLNTTTADVNHTVFVPVDTAFDALPGWHKITAPQAREAIVRYHIGVGAFPYPTLFATRTLSSLYHEPLLGGAPQRLRVGLEKKLGFRINFAARVISPDALASNGIVHAIDTVVVPPTFVGRQLSFVPDHYSTLLHAMNVSGFTQYIHGLTNLNGSTVLAPNNAAFARLGPEINSFLFDSALGLRYLHALLRYTTVPNATAYSDAFYGSSALAPRVLIPGTKTPSSAEHLYYQLPTLLGNTTVTINVTFIHGYSAMLVNNKVRVTVQDGVAKNGVIQEVDRVVFPLPPASVPGSPWSNPPVKTVVDLVARLKPYVEDGDENGDDNKIVAAGSPPTVSALTNEL